MNFALFIFCTYYCIRYNTFCIFQGENGVLESPTGTGKTLSLLCSSLAWLLVKKAQLQASAQNLLMQNTEDFGSLLRGDLDKLAGMDKSNNEDWGMFVVVYIYVYKNNLKNC